jgi:uncharacterized protein YjbI with pentapeptide repeats
MPIRRFTKLLKRPTSTQLPCSMSLKYPWCKDLPSSHNDSKGNRYCIFHAPQGEKGKVSSAKFNDLVFERINNACKNGGLCDLSGTVFEGSVSFKRFFQDHPGCNGIFKDALFPGDVDLSGVAFTEEADFSTAHFCGKVNFEASLFKKNASFNGAIFDEESFFTDAVFSLKAYFFDTTFHKISRFTNAHFGEELYLSIGCFKKGADFNNARYGKRIIFKRPVSGVPK